MTDKLKEQYERELSEQFDWEALKRDCLQSAVEALHSHTLDELRLFDLTDGEAIIGQVYLGTVFALTPSGKYYMPFACSNVASCPECGGDGHAREMCKFNHEENANGCFDHNRDLLCGDCDYNEERQGNTPIMQDCQYCNGQGARDLHELAELRNETPTQTTAFLLKTYGITTRDIRKTVLVNSEHKLSGINIVRTCDKTVFNCNVCRGSGKQLVTCPTCNGLGSAEAYQDQVWYEALESVTDRHDMWYEAGEGDPCNVMVRCWVSFAEITKYILEQFVTIVQAHLDHKATYREVKEGLRVATSLVNKMNQLEKGE